MIITDQEILKQIKAGIANPVEVEKYLLNNFSAPAIAHELAQYVINDDVSKPITLTQAQFFSHFKIQGFRFVDGKLVEETRGQYSKKKD